ncbi:MAG TPA: hypothetical protein VL357_05935 [Rariglobus sp.]|jgi:hypothetical protein|nr:hypothetical protein [Rariglobus sp.]
MKINLDDLTGPEQVSAVIALLARRVAHRNPSDKALYASDLMKHFKVPHLTTRNERLAFFNKLQREAVTAMLAGARKQAAAALAPSN